MNIFITPGRTDDKGRWTAGHGAASTVVVFGPGRVTHRSRRAPWLAALMAAVGAGMAGCNNPSDSLPALTVYEVKGKVVLADGKPLTKGWVYFVPKGDLTITPSGVIGSDGTFSVVTGGSGEGAPSGDYKVRIETPGYQADSKSKKPLFPLKYTDEDSSGLLVTVRAEPNQLQPFQLK